MSTCAGTIFFDENKRILDFDAESVFGYSPEEVIGNSADMLFQDVSVLSGADPAHRLSDKACIETEAWGIHKRGQLLPLRILLRQREDGLLCVARAALPPGNSPDFQDLKLILRAMKVLEGLELENASLSQAAKALRQSRVEDVGLHQYLYDILNSRGNWPAKRFTLWYGDEKYRITDGGEDEIVDALTNLGLGAAGLPDRIEFTEPNGTRRVFYI